MTDAYDRDLDRNGANHAPLSPLGLLERSASVWPDKIAVVHGPLRYTYREFYARCRRLASALARRGIGPGDTVSVLAPNVPALLEAHFGVPMTGAVLNAVNTRLDAKTVAFILDHADSKLLIADRALSAIAKPALAGASGRPHVVDIDDPLDPSGERLGETDYESFIAAADPDFAWRPPADEWEALALNYTSGTTGDPKGVVYHHRGAYLNAIGQILAFGLDRHTVYLWTLPMFHCNGWCYAWGVTAAGGTHVCLRRVEPKAVFERIVEHGVTHLCGAPIVLNMLVHAPAAEKKILPREVQVAVGGAAPPSAVIAAMERMGFRVHHLYGLTETYGPATLCAWQEEWSGLPVEARAARMARQGVAYPTLDSLAVADPETLAPVPGDGRTIGELLIRGNTVMKGYLKNPKATAEAFRGGWFHTGDLAVRHPDGYVEIKDRSKDIIVTGGESVSSLEVEETLTRHPEIMEAAVVARPDATWGETPCAFVTLKPGAKPVAAEEVIAWCRAGLAHYKAPKTVVFGPLPKTSTGKVQKYVLRRMAAKL